MQEAGLIAKARHIDSEKPEDVGYLAAKLLITHGERREAIFAGDDAVARGVYRAVDECGIRIPEDMSVVGFGDVGLETLHPALTSVREFPEQVGKYLAQQLLNRIANPEAPPQHDVVPTQLVVRASCRRLSQRMHE